MVWPFKPAPLFPTGWVVKNIPRPWDEPATAFTPDFMWLERHEYVLLFVYDELMRNRRHYDELIGKDSLSLAAAFTYDRDLALWKKKLGDETFPIPLLGADRVYRGAGITSKKLHKMVPDDLGPGLLARIKGELHAVRPHAFWNGLDKHYLNGVEFQRQRVKVLVPYRLQLDGVGVDHNVYVQEVRCWMYIGIKDYWRNQLDGGMYFTPVGAYFPRSPVTKDGHVMGVYYAYTRLEEDTNF